MDDLDRVMRMPELMPPRTEVKAVGGREYSLLAPEMKEPPRVTTDPRYFEEHAESVELWSPGNTLFKPPEFIGTVQRRSDGETSKDILDG